MDKRSARIKELIEDSGKSYQELETITGIKKSTLQRYASGTTSKIPITAIEKLSQAFNVSPRYMMGWEEVQQKNDALTDIVIRLRTDEEFLSIVQRLNIMDPEKLRSLATFLQ